METGDRAVGPKVEMAPFDPERHRELLRKWLDQPHVAQWWPDTKTIIAELADRNPEDHALIKADGRPVGYICWQSVTAEERRDAGLQDLPGDHIDIDVLIGESDMLGKGIGPAALLLLLNRLRKRGIRSAGLGTHLDDRRARRAYEKAGFKLAAYFREEGRDLCYLVRSLDAR